MVSKNVKMEAPSPLNANPRSQKAPAAEGVALQIKSHNIVWDRMAFEQQFLQVLFELVLCAREAVPQGAPQTCQ